MFLDIEETINIKKSAIKKYTATGAIVLQVLYSEYGNEIPYDPDSWEPLFKGWVDMSAVKSTITRLLTKNKIDEFDDVLYIIGRPKSLPQTVFQVLDVEQPKDVVVAKKESAINPVYDMAETLCDVLGIAKSLQNPKRYLRPAKKYLSAGYTSEFIRDRYGSEGDWYKHEFKGQKGSPPNLSDIEKTVDKKYTGATNMSDDNSTSFYR